MRKSFKIIYISSVLKELDIFPLLDARFELFINFLRAQLVRKVVLCQIGLTLHYVLLLHGPETGLANVLGAHYIFKE